MSSSVNVTINELNQASSIVVLVFSFINIIPGGIGLLFNILIFTRAPLCHEPCAIYFFSSTFFSLILVLIILPVRVVAVIFNIDTAITNLGICKIEYYTLYAARSASSWLIVAACFDRFLHSSTNAHIRRMSSLKKAKITVGMITSIVFLLHCHMIIYYEITYVSDRFGNITSSCSGQKGIYSTFFGFWNLFFYSLGPCILMLLFGLLTLKNLRQHRCVIPMVTKTTQIIRRTDTQLLRMLAAQVLVIIITTLPLPIVQLYSSFTSTVPKKTLQIAQENLVARIVGVITYFPHSTSFFLYTLMGTVFRKEFFKIIKQCWHSNFRLYY